MEGLEQREDAILTWQCWFPELVSKLESISDEFAEIPASKVFDLATPEELETLQEYGITLGSPGLETAYDVRREWQAAYINKKELEDKGEQWKR